MLPNSFTLEYDFFFFFNKPWAAVKTSDNSVIVS